MSKKIIKDDIDRFHDYGIYVPHRTIYMGSESYDSGEESGVDGLMAERFIKNLTVLSTNEAPITIIMNNPGGFWDHGMAIYDAINNCPCEITIQVLGVAMSMGAVILQAADHRTVAPNARVMIHYGTCGTYNTDAKTFQRWAKEERNTAKDMEHIFLKRIKEKHPNFTLKDVQKLLDFDTIYNAKQAIGMGLADKILGEE